MAEEDVWDSWEDFADSNDLDRQVNQHLRLTNGDAYEDDSEPKHEDFKPRDCGNLETCDNGKSTGTQFRILPRPVVHEDDLNRTAYIPQVKILKRPGKDSQGTTDREKEKLKSQPARTLAEREAAYAEARKRIMGPVAPQSSNPTTTNTGRSRPEHRKTRGSKPETSQSNTVQVERIPKGPDKSGRGFVSPR